MNKYWEKVIDFTLSHEVIWHLWCFIRVYGADGDCPAEDYKIKYQYWVDKYNLIDM